MSYINLPEIITECQVRRMCNVEMLEYISTIPGWGVRLDETEDGTPCEVIEYNGWYRGLICEDVIWATQNLQPFPELIQTLPEQIGA